MTVTLDWFGCTTYRFDIDGLVVFLDTFMDRLSSAPDNGATSADITVLRQAETMALYEAA